eukprot:RCo010512
MLLRATCHPSLGRAVHSRVSLARCRRLASSYHMLSSVPGALPFSAVVPQRSARGFSQRQQPLLQAAAAAAAGDSLPVDQQEALRRLSTVKHARDSPVLDSVAGRFSPPTQHNLRVWEAIITAYVRIGLPLFAAGRLEALEKLGVTANTFTLVTESLIATNNLNDAWMVVQRMLQAGLTPDYRLLERILTVTPDDALASEVANQMAAQSSRSVEDILLPKRAAKLLVWNDFEGLEKLLGKTYGGTATATVPAALAEELFTGFLRQQEFERARLVLQAHLEVLRDSEAAVWQTVQSYEADGLYHYDQLSKILSLIGVTVEFCNFALSLERETYPLAESALSSASLNELSLSSLAVVVRRLVKKGKIQAAEMALGLMEKKGILLTSAGLSGIVTVMARASHLERAEALLARMQERGVVPTPEALSAIIEENVAAGAMDKALAQMEKMQGLGSGIGLTTFSKLLADVVSKKDAESEAKLDRALRPAVKGLLGELMEELCRTSAMPAAEWLWAKGLMVPRSWGLLAAGFCKLGDVEGVAKVFSETPAENLSTLHDVLSSEMEVLRRAGNADALFL